MDAKTLLENADRGAWIFNDESKRVYLSALRLAATLEGPEEATPETDACQGSDGTIRECDELADKSRSLEQRMYRALRALRECEERAGKIEVERDSFKGYAESLHGWMDRVLSCVERAEQDIGGETMGAIILAGGPIYESFSEYLAALAAKGNGNG